MIHSSQPSVMLHDLSIENYYKSPAASDKWFGEQAFFLINEGIRESLK